MDKKILNEKNDKFTEFRIKNYKEFKSIKWFRPKEDWRRFNIEESILNKPWIQKKSSKKYYNRIERR